MSNKVDMMSRWCINQLEQSFNIQQNKKEETMYEGSLEYMQHKKAQREWIEKHNLCENCLYKYKMLISRTCSSTYKPIKIK